MVELINPQFGERIYDPTCGTGGFLIHAFNHIKRTCKLTPANLKILQEETIFGSELTNTARIAKMNMIITGDGHTNIKQLDCLKYPINEEFDVVVANPPYGQSTDWGDLYLVPSVQADPIFIQHIMKSLNVNGRASVIVPEGFLFRTGTDERTRKVLLKDFNLIAVISLPQGVFNPYTDSKTDIIIFQKEGKPTQRVWFFDLQYDGFDLGRTRQPIDKNDIPDLINKWIDKDVSENSIIVETEKIIVNNYDLRVNAYIEDKMVGKRKSNTTKLSTFLKRVRDIVDIEDNKTYKLVKVKLYGGGAELREERLGADIKTKKMYRAREGDLIVSKIDARNGAIAIIPPYLDGAIVTSDFPLFIINNKKANPQFLHYFFKYNDVGNELETSSKGTTNRRRVSNDTILSLEIPLPSISIQNDVAKKMNNLHLEMSNLRTEAQRVMNEIENKWKEGSKVNLRLNNFN